MEAVIGGVLIVLGLALLVLSKPMADRVSAIQTRATQSELYRSWGWRLYLIAMAVACGLMLLYVGSTMVMGHRPFGVSDG